MANKAIKKTIAMVEAEKAREAVKTAKEKYKKTGTATDKTALENAEKAAKPKIETENRERYKRVAGIRTATAIAAIELLAKTTNRASMKFSKADTDLIVEAVEKAVVNLKTAYEAVNVVNASESPAFAFPD